MDLSSINHDMGFVTDIMINPSFPINYEDFITRKRILNHCFIVN